MSTQHKIDKVADMLTLSPEEFARMLPDLCAWYEFSRSIPHIDGYESTGFIWVDDGVHEITEVQLTSKKTGEVLVVKFRDDA